MAGWLCATPQHHTNQVIPVHPLNGVHPATPQRAKHTQERASPFWWGLWFFRLRRKKHKPHSKGERTWFPQEGGSPSTGVTCGGLCLRKAKHARKSVPAHSGGVFAFFDEVEKRKHPTPKGSVREPGSLTHPQMTPIEGVHLRWALLAQGEKRT